MAPEEVPLDQVVLGGDVMHWLTARRSAPLLSSNTQEWIDAVMEGGRLRADEISIKMARMGMRVRMA